MIELGKWYKYHGVFNRVWNILPLCIYDNKVFSIDVQIDVGPNVRIDLPVDISWFTSDSSLMLSTDPPSFSDIHLSYEQYIDIFNAIFRSKE